jgi:carbamoylphosphate synthase small subunit
MGRKRVDRVARWDFITKEATERSQAKTAKERLYFDYFNPNGAYKQHLAFTEKVTKLVREGKVRGGVLVAYDIGYYEKNLSRLAMRNCSCTPFESHYYGDQILELTRKMEKTVDEQLAFGV